MNQVIQFPKAAMLVDAPLVVDPNRSKIVHDMAMHIVAGMTGGLDISKEEDVIRYLTNTPERYRASIICMHLDDAIYEARQTVIFAVFGGR